MNHLILFRDSIFFIGAAIAVVALIIMLRVTL